MRILNDFQSVIIKYSSSFSAYCSAIHVIFSDINVILFVNLSTTVRMTLYSLSDKVRMKFRIRIWKKIIDVNMNYKKSYKWCFFEQLTLHSEQ